MLSIAALEKGIMAFMSVEDKSEADSLADSLADEVSAYVSPRDAKKSKPRPADADGDKLVRAPFLRFHAPLHSLPLAFETLPNVTTALPNPHGRVCRCVCVCVCV